MRIPYVMDVLLLLNYISSSGPSGSYNGPAYGPLYTKSAPWSGPLLDHATLGLQG